jgi:hypothetical protein
MGLGQEHPEEPFIILGQIWSGIYFGSLLVFLPLLGILENTFFDHTNNNYPANNSIHNIRGIFK